MDFHQTVGADLVNHCVNDIAVQGATPLFFMDYLATGKLEPHVAEQLVEGIADACRHNGCALIGGETAEMPGFYPPGEYDLAGFIVGAVDRSKILTGKDVKAGDVLIGLPSNGLHTNGYSLARKLLFEVAGYSPDKYINDLKEKVGNALMRTHKSYWPVMRRLLDANCLSAAAHITGGGITENLPRILPERCTALIERDAWETPALFRFLADAGKVSDEEMLRAFNMGIGIIAAVGERDAQGALDLIHEHGGKGAVVIGRIAEGDRGVAYL